MEAATQIPFDVGLLTLALTFAAAAVGVVVWLVRLEGRVTAASADTEHLNAAYDNMRTKFSDFREKVAAEYVSVASLDKMMAEIKGELRVVREMVIQLLQAEGLKRNKQDNI